MKMNMFLGSLMLGASLCTPSFGGGLLDRMLGLKGAGCDSTCCDTGCNVDPSCGCESARGCGLKGLLSGPSCGCESACGGGCAADPSCGCESACGNGSGCGLKGLLSGPSCGCESACGNGCGAAPSCGCESGCASGPSCGCETASCKPRRKPLMELLKALKPSKSCCDSGCASDPSCGCESACGNGCGNGCGAAPSCGCESACGNGCGAAPSCGCETACGGCDAGPGPIAKMHQAKARLLSKLFKKRAGCDSASCDSGCASACSSCSSCGSTPVSAPAVHSDAAPMAPAPVVDPSAYLQSNRRVVQATSYVR